MIENHEIGRTFLALSESSLTITNQNLLAPKLFWQKRATNFMILGHLPRQWIFIILFVSGAIMQSVNLSPGRQFSAPYRALAGFCCSYQAIFVRRPSFNRTLIFQFFEQIFKCCPSWKTPPPRWLGLRGRLLRHCFVVSKGITDKSWSTLTNLVGLGKTITFLKWLVL